MFKMEGKHKEVINYDVAMLPDLLPIYYKRLFPFHLYYRWMSYGNIEKSTFTQREFSFTLNDDIYLRYQSFSDQAQLEKEIKAKNPFKIDIGAIYSAKPRDHRVTTNFQPVEKELVFDIDLTDYDDVRTCCSGADICQKCWLFIVVAMKILDRVLSEDFGYRHILWVYSGRRGVHCWVCDESARKLSNNARSAVAEYISVLKGGEFKTKKVQLGDRIHPSIQEALKIIEEHFSDLILDKQDFFSTDENCKKVVALCNDQKMKTALEENLYQFKNSKDIWEYLKSTTKNISSKEKTKGRYYIEEVMLQLCYPRLDINVTKGLNHLLKAPFCVHPKTGRICVPIDIRYADKFDPFSVPIISQLCEEINLYDKNLVENDNNKDKLDDENDHKNIKDFKKTSLVSSIEIFKKFIRFLEGTWKSKRLQQSDMKREF